VVLRVLISIQISLDCIEKLVGSVGRFNKGEIDADTFCQIEKHILTESYYWT